MSELSAKTENLENVITQTRQRMADVEELVDLKKQGGGSIERALNKSAL